MTYKININLDAKCKRCGKGGAESRSGVCMPCYTKAIKSGELDHIIKKVRKEAKEKLIKEGVIKY